MSVLVIHTKVPYYIYGLKYLVFDIVGWLLCLFSLELFTFSENNTLCNGFGALRKPGFLDFCQLGFSFVLIFNSKEEAVSSVFPSL